MAAPATLPTGTVTFLFTDVEGSTPLLNAHPEAYRRAAQRHHELLVGVVEAHGGVVFETLGDGVYAAFSRPTDAVQAALEGQLALKVEPCGETPIKVRMGVHLGEVELQGEHYFGASLVRCGRLMSTAHGGQVVVSEVVAIAVRDALPGDAGLRDLGAHRLKDLARPERVYQLVHPELRAEFPALRSLDALPSNLPVQLTSFVGRDVELADTVRLLAETRLVTLTGPGGTGKTRLALQVAAEVLPASPDGVWLVELAPLAPLADPARLAATVAHAAGVREDPTRTPLAALVEALREKRVLLLFDNCEHLLDACATVANTLLRGCPLVRLLATRSCSTRARPTGCATATRPTAWRGPTGSQRPPKDRGQRGARRGSGK